jgi:hypothetical protein
MTSAGGVALRTSGCARDESDLIREGEEVESGQLWGELNGRHDEMIDSVLVEDTRIRGIFIFIY